MLFISDTFVSCQHQSIQCRNIVSTKHIVHTTEGKAIGEWGIRKWLQSHAKHL